MSGDNFHEIHPFAILQVSGDAKRYETGDEDNYSQVGFESFVTHSTWQCNKFALLSEVISTCFP